MMKKTAGVVLLCWMVFPVMAMQPCEQAETATCTVSGAPMAMKPCEELKAEIDAKMQAKGVKMYTLEVVPTEGTKNLAEGSKIIGSCDGGAHKIVYTRGTGKKKAE